jgi:hypothetical protein
VNKQDIQEYLCLIGIPVITTLIALPLLFLYIGFVVKLCLHILGLDK